MDPGVCVESKALKDPNTPPRWSNQNGNVVSDCLVVLSSVFTSSKTAQFDVCCVGP